MRIGRIEASLHRVPLATPLLSETRRVPVVVVRVETDDGLVGYGAAGAQTAPAVLALINRELGPFLVGRDPLLGEACWHAMNTQFNPRSATGLLSCALSGIDIALWDLRGRVAGQPVWRLLGGFTGDVPAYVTFGLPEYDVDQLAEAFRLPIGNGGGWADHNAPLFAAVPNGWGVEVHAWQWGLAQVLYTDVAAAHNGVLTLSDTPGLGLQPRPDVLRDTLERD